MSLNTTADGNSNPSGATLNTSVPSNINDTYAVPSLPVESISDKEDKAKKGVANGYAPLDANAKVPVANLPDQASLDAEVDGKITTHNSATTSVHGIANTANLVLTNDPRLSNARTPTAHTHAPSQITGTAVVTNDARLSDPRRSLPYPILSETLFTGVRAEKRVYNRSYNAGDEFWEVTTTITQLPLVSDTYYDSEVIYAFGEVHTSISEWYIDKSPSVAFGTSATNGLIFVGDDEGAKILKLGTIVIPPLPTPAPAPPYYTPNATFNESFSATLIKSGDWYDSSFAIDWNNNSPSKNIFNSKVSSNVSDVLMEWMEESNGNLSQFNNEMASTNILLRCSKRYTSWTNGVSPSVEGNGNIIVEIIFYGIPRFGTTAGTFCQGNDSRLSNARTPTAHTHSISDVTGLQGSYATLVNGVIPISQLPTQNALDAEVIAFSIALG